jgi:hypothetical protein
MRMALGLDVGAIVVEGAAAPAAQIVVVQNRLCEISRAGKPIPLESVPALWLFSSVEYTSPHTSHREIA